MKKRIVILSFAATCIMSLASCQTKIGNQTESPVTTETVNINTEDNSEMIEKLSGGWSASKDTKITDEQRTIFDKATETITGVTYTPVAYLGSQVVAGTNHAFLCKTEPSVKELNGKAYWTVVYIYEKPDGECEILESATPDIALSSDKQTVQYSEDNGENLLGAWEMSETFNINDDVRKSFDDALANTKDVSYDPVMILGSQVVAGSNYSILCRSEDSNSESSPYWSVVYIYRNLDGEGKLLNIATFELSAN